MKKRFKKRRFYLIRPIDGMLPLAFLAADLLGPGRLKGWYFASWFAVRLLSLFTADGVRMAFATQLGMKKVRGSTTLALLLQIVGALIVFSPLGFIYREADPFAMTLIGTGLLLNIEHVFAEYMRAQGDGYSADLCTFLTSVFFLAGVMLNNAEIPYITLGMTAVGCLITLLLAVLTGGYRPARPNMAVIRHIPRSLLYGLAYPAVYIAVIFGLDALCGCNSGTCVDMWNFDGLLTGFYVGLAFIQVVKTPFRRSSLECRILWPILAGIVVISAAAVCCGLFIPGIPGFISGFAICFGACIFASVAVTALLWCSFRKTE